MCQSSVTGTGAWVPNLMELNDTIYLFAVRNRERDIIIFLSSFPEIIFLADFIVDLLPFVLVLSVCSTYKI